MTAFGMPCSRMRRVSARVSRPASAMTLRFFSHVSRSSSLRQFDGAVGRARKIAPRAAAAAAGDEV